MTRMPLVLWFLLPHPCDYHLQEDLGTSYLPCASCRHNPHNGRARKQQQKPSPLLP